MTRDTILSAWERHCREDWPRFASPNQGPLMTVDTVISGCVVFYLDTPEGLDQQRVEILKDCLADIEELTLDLDESAQAYFLQLRRLGELLLAATPQP
jgi:hypothetical protein